MLRFGVALAVGLLVSTYGQAAIGTVGGRGSADEPAATTCDMNTGACTGQDAGTGLFTAAVCDGVTNTLAAFNSFNAWALTSTAQAQGKLIELRVTGTCFASGGNARPFKGLTKVRLWGYGTTFTGTGAMPGLGVADTVPGICHKALDNASGCSARLNTVSAGSTSVTINTTGYSGSLSALCSRFVTGKWAVVTGFDLQGGYNAPYGYPPNPHFFDYVQIGSTANCASTGAIDISRPLTYGYLSTWPLFNAGNSGESDQGGPATIYALDQYWGGEVDLRGFELTDTANQSIYQGRYVKLQNVTMQGSHCIIPSQNETFEMVNSTGTSCAIEVDKIINNLTYRGTTLRRLMFQSSSTNTLTWDGGSLVLDLNGTPKVANISNLTTPTIKLGPYAYGTGTSATCTNCVITNEIDGSGLSEDGRQVGALPFYTISGGVWSYPLGATVTGVADNGSGKARLTVASTTGWVTGATASQSSLWSACTVPGGCTGGLTITVVDSTHIDIQYNFSQVTWSGGGFLYNTAEQERWAIPGTNILPGAFQGYAEAFQVTGVTQSGNFVNIATTLPGGYPTVPLNGATSANIRVQMPSWRCINCSGNPQAAGDFNLAPDTRPINSYVNRTYSNSTSMTSLKAWGTVNSIKFNVTDAYVGATDPLRFVLSGFAYPANTTVLAGFNWTINLRQAGLREITTSGVTCDGVPGACSGDTIAAFGDASTYLAGVTNLSKPQGSPTDDPWSLNVEYNLDQGVVP